jgi:hypothetical protein
VTPHQASGLPCETAWEQDGIQIVWERKWARRRRSHYCGRDDGHEGEHVCELCGDEVDDPDPFQAAAALIEELRDQSAASASDCRTGALNEALQVLALVHVSRGEAERPQGRDAHAAGVPESPKRIGRHTQ